MEKLIVFKNEMNMLTFIPSYASSSLSKVIPTDSKYFYIESSIGDSHFVECYDVDWSLNNGETTTYVVDIEKAKQKFIKHIRDARNIVFPNLDVEFMKALEIGNSTADIVLKKQTLRDLPTMNLSDVTTIDELKGKWPAYLLGNSPYEN
jgi:hypothetical protein